MKNAITVPLFDQFRDNILSVDPVYFCERNLVVDGKPLKLNGSGYKPFADIYRYIALKAIDKDSKPVVLVKGRQVGATTMAAALECYFTGCGIFGKNGRPPMRMIHLFPTLSLAAAYTKDKLDPMIGQSQYVPGTMTNRGMPKSFMEDKFDASSPANNNMHFKKFLYGNQVWIDSTGLDGDRIRGRTVDCALFDECFPYDQCITTENGKETIGKLVNLFKNKKETPKVLSYNLDNGIFEFKKITNAWNRGKKSLLQITAGNREIKCTPNHKFLDIKNNWVEAKNLVNGSVIKTTTPNLGQISYNLNEDQFQIMIGSFLGDGHIRKHGNKRYRLIINHGMKQSEYCEWKSSIFKSKTTIITKNGYSQKPAIGFKSKLFVLDDCIGIKNVCPQWVLDQIDERGLAIWFMDDGSVNGNSAVISTCSFDEDSQKRIVKKLNDFGIECEYRYYKTKGSFSDGYFSIYITKKGYEKLCNLIYPYVHKSMDYKIKGMCCNSYIWNSDFLNFGAVVVDNIKKLEKEEITYDLEVEDNHNFIVTTCRASKNNGGLIAHNCQDITDIAMGAVTKILAQARYGAAGQGIQVYFGTPKTKGGSYWEMWKNSSQNYYHLRCEKCGKYFPLYRPDINWEDVWIYGLTVKCPECGQEQDKLEAQERGKWIPLNNPDETDFVGYHINQLYIPTFTKEVIEKAKPDRNPINTERIYMNEVLGEFYDGEGGTISIDQIHEKCADRTRGMVKIINPSITKKRVYAGFDWGQRGALEQMVGRGRGRSYSCVVILTVEGNLFNVEFATRLDRNDPEHKMQTVEEMFRRYNMHLSVGDIGDANDLTHNLQRTYDERFLASRASHKVLGHVKYSKDEWPKTIVFEKDYYISEMIGLLKEGRIKFPYKNYDRISWLIEHCASMDIKVTKDKSGEPIRKFVKGTGPNDGLMALLNAYLAWKFDVTQGFSIANPNFMKTELATEARPVQAILGYIPNMFGGRR